MKKIIALFFISSLFISCAPRVFTENFKSYPPLSETQNVQIFEKKDEVPSYAEPLGQVFVESTKWSYEEAKDQAMEVTESEVRKIGGNAFFVSKYLIPSFYESSNHRFLSVALKVDPPYSAESQSGISFYSFEDNYERFLKKLPQHNLDLSTGYSFLTVSDEENDLNSGISYCIGYHYHPKGRKSGFGLIYSKYVGAPFSQVFVRNIKTGRDIEIGLNINYVGVSIAYKDYLNDNWLFSYNFGIGPLTSGFYFVDSSSIFSRDYIDDLNHTMIGGHFCMNIERKITKFCSSFVDFGAIGGNYKDKNIIDENNKPVRISASRVIISTGLRFFIN